MIITANDYLQFDGIDLDLELPDDDNSLHKVDRFLEEVEDDFFDDPLIYGNGITKDNVGDLVAIKKALCYQVRHKLKYGRDYMLDYGAYRLLHSKGLVNALRG